MYHTLWFTLLLVAIALNIIVCTFERFPSKWKSLLKVKPSLNPSIIDRLTNKTVFRLDEDFDTVKARVAAVIKKKKFKFVGDTPTEGGYIFHG